MEQHDVRESVKRNLYTGRTYNSVENIAQFFADRGMPPPSGFARRPQAASTNASTVASKPAAPPQPRAPQTLSRPGSGFRPAAPRRTLGFAAGAVVQHPKYGRGTVLRREGDGEDAKLTISFPGHGLKKIVEKYAGIKIDE